MKIDFATIRKDLVDGARFLIELVRKNSDLVESSGDVKHLWVVNGLAELFPVAPKWLIHIVVATAYGELEKLGETTTEAAAPVAKPSDASSSVLRNLLAK